MPTMTISISDDLKEKLEKFKDRMNISKVCQEALERKISYFSSIPVDKKEFEELIIKLREDKVKFENEWENGGFKFGVEDFSKLDYESIQKIVSSLSNIEYAAVNYSPYDQLVNGISDDNFEELKDWFDRNYDKTSKECFENWLFGYAKGIDEMYRKIEDNL